jgi:DNA mismatch endonuclease (patch repair protein)
MIFTKARVAVFLDGCFWHGCPEHHTVAETNADFWAQKVVTNRARDRDTDRRLAEAGWTSIRVWEHEDPREAASKIRKIVDERRLSSRIRHDDSGKRVEPMPDPRSIEN